jgi:hypothetical protein
MKKVLPIKSYLISCEGVTAGFKMLKQTAFNNYIVRRDLYLSTINPILVGYIYCQGMSFAFPIYVKNSSLYLIMVTIILFVFFVNQQLKDVLKQLQQDVYSRFII